ncbi:NupC/NupG family nucleoside CNT transporter [Nonlabens spongiae]|uniref:NupC/NupG family nucleoside CNT transporter n=1 Tax=Nonlabens spongiae TaxID=331648 RepID=UPI001FEAE8E5|nr:nucleoside transporter C-terminal domain-containing protein [Nonlabens spongiae]
MNTYFKFLFFCFFIFSNSDSLVAQEIIDLQGTWIIEERSQAEFNVDSLVFTNQNYKLYASTDSLNQQGKFMLQNNFLALFPSSNENQVYQFDLGLDQDRLALDGQLGSYNLVKTSIVKNTNVAISENLGFSFESFYRGLIGVAFILAFAFLLSKDRKNIDWKLVAVGLSLQIVFALGVLKVGFIASIFEGISEGIVAFLNTSEAGAEFLFGSLIDDTSSIGYIFAFKVLPTIIFFSAFTSVLYYLGILQKVVYVFAWVMSKTMRLSGAESLAAAANIFIGQTEAPLVVKPYLEKMTKSELLCLMVGGMATIAGGVLAAFIGFLGGDDVSQQILFTKHLLTASIMSAPAAIVIAKMLYPESKELNVDRSLNVSKDKIGSNILDAISKGTIDGLKLAVNVGAMLLVFTALIAVFNWFLGDLIGDATGLNGVITDYTDGRYTSFSLQYIR